MTPLEEFTGLVAQRDAATEFAEREALQVEYNAELKRMWDAGHTNTRRAFTPKTAEDWLGERLEAVQQPFRDRLKLVAKAAEDRREAVTTRLVALAPLIDLAPVPGHSGIYATVDPGRFSTQSNPHHYAEGFAKVMVAEVATAGVVATVERSDRNGGEYHIVVPLDPVRVEALKCRAGLGAKDFLKLCWRNGINPRVILPFPAGLEEKYGIDYFGNDLPTKGGA